MAKRIGFDRMIKIEWLDAIAGIIRDEEDPNEIRSAMHSLLENELPQYEARRKTITVLLRIWYRVPPEHTAIRDRGLVLLPHVNQNDRIWIHWGMILLAFPFFRDISRVLNRCFSFHDSCTPAEIQRKMEETWGRRDNMTRAMERVLQSLRSWDIIRKEIKGDDLVFTAPIPAQKKDTELWFMESLLLSEESQSIPMDIISRFPTAFPFLITLEQTDILNSGRFNVQQLSGNRSEIVMKNGK
jgi:hypothetical protein